MQISPKLLTRVTRKRDCFANCFYNRFEKKTGYLLRPAKEQKVYRQEFNLPEAVSGKSHTLTVRQQGLPSQHTDTELSNLRIRPRKIAL